MAVKKVVRKKIRKLIHENQENQENQKNQKKIKNLKKKNNLILYNEKRIEKTKKNA